MGKEIIYNLQYRDNGERKSIDIKIDFLSRGIARDFERMTKKQEEIKEKWESILESKRLIDDYKLEKPKEWKEAIKPLYDKIDTVTGEIRNFDKDGFVEDQFKLIQAILRDNGVKNQMLMTFDFWEYKVDVNEMLNFLYAAVYKDIDLKKKQ